MDGVSAEAEAEEREREFRGGLPFEHLDEVLEAAVLRTGLVPLLCEEGASFHGEAPVQRRCIVNLSCHRLAKPAGDPGKEAVHRTVDFLNLDKDEANVAFTTNFV